MSTPKDLEAARNAALEEAARVAEAWRPSREQVGSFALLGPRAFVGLPKDIAARIRALKTTPPAPVAPGCVYVGRCNSSRCPVHGTPPAPDPLEADRIVLAACHAITVTFENQARAVSKGSAPYGEAFLMAALDMNVGEAIRNALSPTPKEDGT